MCIIEIATVLYKAISCVYLLFDFFRYVWLMQRKRRRCWKRSLGSWTNWRTTHYLKSTSIKQRWVQLVKTVLLLLVYKSLSPFPSSLSPSPPPFYSFSSGMFDSWFRMSRGWLWPTLGAGQSTSHSSLSSMKRTFASLGWRSNQCQLSSSLVSWTLRIHIHVPIIL